MVASYVGVATFGGGSKTGTQTDGEGFLQWHICPRLTAAPLLAGAYCWVPWGDHSSSVPLKILHSLAPVLCLCAEPYRALPWERVRQFITLSVPLVSVLLQECAPWLWCVDVEWDIFSDRIGAFSLFLGARSWVVPGVKHMQQSAELAGLAVGPAMAVGLLVAGD